MTTQNYLRQIEKCNAVIENQIISINQLDEMLCSISGKSLDPNKVQLSVRTDKMQEKIAKLVDEEAELAELIEKYLEAKKEIENKIAQVPNASYYRILMGRYVHNKTFKQIAIENNYSRKQVYRLHDKALDCFEEMFESSYKDYGIKDTKMSQNDPK